MSQALDALEDARSAAGRQHWRRAYEAYSDLPDDELAPEDLERFAEAAWWMGGLDEAIGLRERAYALFSAAGTKLKAARVALKLADDYSGRGAFAVSQGWFANAERLLNG